jgi:hemolysin activation/secretion protein
VSRLQALTATTTAYFSFSGQAASKNLDSSEQFTLGGPTAVRAYPTGEAVGDEGWLLNAELRWDFMPNWQLSGFIDHGRIQLHHSTWTGWQFGNADLPNAYSLSGAGVGLTYSRPGDLSVRMVVADAIGSNPGHGITGNNADNRPSRLRGWLQLVKTF